MHGYWKLPDETAHAPRGGWFHSGDVGTMDDDGYVSIVDRVKDMINVSGFKVWPAEVEEAFYTHPSVLEAAVYGIPDPVRGESVAAAVTLRPNRSASAGELLAHIQDRVARYKLPKTIDIVPQLPKGATGKSSNVNCGTPRPTYRSDNTRRDVTSRDGNRPAPRVINAGWQV